MADDCDEDNIKLLCCMYVESQSLSSDNTDYRPQDPAKIDKILQNGWSSGELGQMVKKNRW